MEVKFPFNEGQLEGIEKAVKWFRAKADGRHTKWFFFLAGYAGTGKTTVASEIVRRMVRPHEVAYIAPTGKAAARMREKGCYDAMTIHQFMYSLADGIGEDGGPRFVLKGSLERRPRLIVLDEGSMVGKRIAMDLKALCIPVLVLGDTGQVEPVNDEPFFVEGSEDHLLEKVERNTGNILRAAFFIRTGGRLPVRNYEDVKVYERRIDSADVRAHVDNDSIILCSWNDTRRKYNALARTYKGISNQMPEIGEKIICTFNQRKFNVMNGELFEYHGYKELPVDLLSPGEEPEFVKLAILKSLADGKEVNAKFALTCFIGIDQDERDNAMKSIGGFDFGYAITVHKSQGSEWENVLVIEEPLKSCSYAKLQYTAVTRAKKHLTYFRRAG